MSYHHRMEENKNDKLEDKKKWVVEVRREQ